MSGNPVNGRYGRLGKAITGAVVAATCLNLATATPALASAGTTSGRLAGPNRYATAAAMASASQPGPAAVIVSSGRNYPDALAGAYLGLNIPADAQANVELLTDPDNLSPETADALNRLRPSEVFLLGLQQAVSDNVAAQIGAIPSGSSKIKVTRIGGATRYDTMQMIDTYPNQGGFGPGVVGGKRTAIVASGLNFPDALAAGPLSFWKRLPIVLTDPDAFSPQARATLAKLGIEQVLIMGGALAVSPSVESAINANGQSTLKRFDGANRYETATKLAAYVTSGSSTLGGTNSPTYLASGANYPDALVGAQIASAPSPILLSGPATLSPDTAGYLRTNAASVGNIIGLGGPAALADPVLGAAVTAAGGDASNPCAGDGCVGSGTSHPSTSAPDLVGASIVANNFGSGPSTIKFSFDKQITSIPGSGHLHLIGPTNSDVATPVAGACSIDPDGVSADCPITTAKDPTKYTRVVADGGSTGTAGAAVAGTGGGNVLGQVVFSGDTAMGGAFGPGPGAFAGPRLRSAVGALASNRVGYTFSSPILASSVHCLDFFIVGPGGGATPASADAPVVVNSSGVTCQFASVSGMVGAGNIGSATPSPGAGTQEAVNGGALAAPPAATDATTPAQNPVAPSDVSASAF